MKKQKAYFKLIRAEGGRDSVPFNVGEPLSNPIDYQYLWIVDNDCMDNKFANTKELNEYLYKFTCRYLSELTSNVDIRTNSSVSVDFGFEDFTMFAVIHSLDSNLYTLYNGGNCDFRADNIATFKRFMSNLKTDIGCLSSESQEYQK